MQEKKSKTNVEKVPGGFRTQAISQPDHRQKKTGVALPDEANVKRARDWVIENEK